MKKSFLAIVLLTVGVTFTNAQQKESDNSLQKASEIETFPKAEAKTEVQSLDLAKAETVEDKTENQNEVNNMNMMTLEAAKSTEDTVATKNTRKEIIE